MMETNLKQLFKIFMPYLYQLQQAVEERRTRLVHYTSADAAMNILRSKEIWMRESSCMNDFTEVEHGLKCLLSAYNSEIGDKFKSALNSALDGITADVEKLFNDWIPHLRTDTYFTCLSEHDDAEDDFGRLSMWRAYSETTGVALVVNNAFLFTESDVLNSYTSPVAYLNEEDFKTNFDEISKSIRENTGFIKNQDRETVTGIVFRMLIFAALSAKHPGFAEEREWRVIHTPAFGHSPHLTREIRAINGVPQLIYKIPLKNTQNETLSGREIPELINRIIIGPTQYPSAMWKAFVTLLEEAGVKNPGTKVFVSNIPLRR